NLGTDVGEVVFRIIIVQAGGAFAAGVMQHTLSESSRRDIGSGQARPVRAERIIWRLIRRGREAIERDNEVDTNCHVGAPKDTKVITFVTSIGTLRQVPFYR